MKHLRNFEVHRVDTELYPDSPLLEVSTVWLKLHDQWFTPDLRQARPDIYEDHLYWSHRSPALKLVEEQLALNEQEWNKNNTDYHRRLWQLASIMMEDMG